MALKDVRTTLGEAFTPVAADVTDPTVAGQLIDDYAPRILVLNAGARPLNRPIQHHTWQTFSRNWEVDVAQAFHWTREALLRPLDPGSVVIAMSSGAAVMGSPTSGGYAGANATVRFISAYAAEESERAGLGIRFVSVLPKLTPTGVGAAGVTAYAARYAKGDVAAYLDQLGPTLTPEKVGEAITALAADTSFEQPAYMLTPAGLMPAKVKSPSQRPCLAGRSGSRCGTRRRSPRNGCAAADALAACGIVDLPAGSCSHAPASSSYCGPPPTAYQ
jgi:NAD(P)-dependent dehydrogenase (short-subunit alcohol dehydrogenase family)